MKILFLLSRFPYPIDKGDKLRAYYQMRYLSKNNDIYFFSIDEDNSGINISNELFPVKGFKRISINKYQVLKNLSKGIFSNIPFQTSYYTSLRNKKHFQEYVDFIQPDIIICQLVRMAELINTNWYDKIVIDYVDTLSHGLKRRAQNSNFILKSLLKLEYNRVKKYEKLIFNRFGKGIIITQNDRDKFEFSEKKQLKIISNGIDYNYYTRYKIKRDIDILFTGNMNYPPNVEAVKYFIKNIWNKVLTINKSTKLYIVGISPHPSILKHQSDNIVVTGFVEDIREYYSRAKIFVAPMRTGSGLQNKILEAMSMELPCIISSLAQGGINANHNDNIYVIDDPEKVVAKICELLNNDIFRDKLGEKARKFVINNHSWDKIINDFQSYIVDSTSKN